MSSRLLLAALAFLALEAAAQNARPTLIADSRTGCKVWNLYPDPEDAITWSGACVNGLAHGVGVLRWLNGGKEVVRYEGEYREGKENGRGVTIWEHGSRYEGEYRNGLPNGNGTYRSDSGEIYSGTWTNGCFKQGNRVTWAHTTREDCGF